MFYYIEFPYFYAEYKGSIQRMPQVLCMKHLEELRHSRLIREAKVSGIDKHSCITQKCDWCN